MHRAATFDPTGHYRYSLKRQWDATAPAIAFVMLNPSTANAEWDDPTVRRCIRLAQSWGFGTLEVVNLFAWCATHPRELRRAAEPVGPENDRYLQAAAQQASCLILAWGNGGGLYQRDRAVLELLIPYRCYCLGKTQTGHPRHPLYLRRDVTRHPIGAPQATECPRD